MNAEVLDSLTRSMRSNCVNFFNGVWNGEHVELSLEPSKWHNPEQTGLPNEVRNILEDETTEINLDALKDEPVDADELEFWSAQ